MRLSLWRSCVNTKRICLNTTNAWRYFQAPEGYVVEVKLESVNFGSHTCAEEAIIVRDGVSSRG